MHRERVEMHVQRELVRGRRRAAVASGLGRLLRGEARRGLRPISECPQGELVGAPVAIRVGAQPDRDRQAHPVGVLLRDSLAERRTPRVDTDRRTKHVQGWPKLRDLAQQFG